MSLTNYALEIALLFMHIYIDYIFSPTLLTEEISCQTDVSYPVWEDETFDVSSFV